MKVVLRLLFVGIALSVLAGVFLSLNSKGVDFNSSIAELEYKASGSLGIAAINTQDGKRLSYHANDRFALCSTFKLLLVADILSRVDQGIEKLDEPVSFGKQDILSYAPVTQKYLPEGSMTVAQLSQAAIEYSDNTAANLLLRRVGGPAGLTDFIRSLGDQITRLDRQEPDLNTNIPLDKRDTTTPAAMLETMVKLLTGTYLSDASKSQLIDWMVGCKTGTKAIRAGINPTWKVGDKTGSGPNGAANDVAIIWPINKQPFLVVVYYTGSQSPLNERNQILAEVGRIVSKEFYKF